MSHNNFRFAEGTTVTPERSQQEISETLRRYGASGFAYGWEDTHAVIRFRFSDRVVRFDLQLPAPTTDPEFQTTSNGRRRTSDSAKAAYEQELRRRWRALTLAIKAKLEAVAAGITTFEEEFLAHLELPDGSTVGTRVVAEVDRAWKDGVAPPRLLALPAGGGQ